MGFSVRNLLPREVINWGYHLPQSIAANIVNGFPARDMQIIGVTGTDGKTTTSTAIYQLLKQSGKKAGLLTTVEAIIGEEHLDTGFHTTTPNTWALQKILKKGQEAGIKHFIIESTSHGLSQFRLWGIPYKIGVVTNVTHEHLDFHKTFEDYLKAKARLFDQVKVAILNRDDPSFEYFANYVSMRNTKAKIISYSIDQPADLQATEITPSEDGYDFVIKINSQTFPQANESITIHSKLIGEFNISNLLAACGAGLASGLTCDQIRTGLDNFGGVAGRQEKLFVEKRTIFIDFAHTPNAMDSLIKSVKKIFPKSKILLVFGATGQRDRSKRPLMGEIAVTTADLSIITSDDTYLEPIAQIVKEITKGCRLTSAQEIETNIDKLPKEKCYLIETDRGKAIQMVVNLSRPGDVILLLGKGHERSINLGGIEHPWSDKEAILEAFATNESN